MRKESAQSIAQAARRVGSVITIVGEQNLKILCEVAMHTPSGLRWFIDGVEVSANEVSQRLVAAQGGES